MSTDYAGTMSTVVKLSEEIDDSAPLAFDVSPRWKCARLQGQEQRAESRTALHVS